MGRGALFFNSPVAVYSPMRVFGEGLRYLTMPAPASVPPHSYNRNKTEVVRRTSFAKRSISPFRSTGLSSHPLRQYFVAFQIVVETVAS